MTRVYRIQDADGRGPWRPGFSVKWCDPNFGPGVEDLPPYFVEFGHDLLKRRGLPGEHYGCAVRKPQDLCRWVSATERAKLATLGFNIVSLKPDPVWGAVRQRHADVIPSIGVSQISAGIAAGLRHDPQLYPSASVRDQEHTVVVAIGAFVAGDLQPMRFGKQPRCRTHWRESPMMSAGRS